MLEKKPELRPATAGEALRELALAAARAGETIPEGPPSLPRPTLAPASQREHSRETADTTLQPFSPGSLSDPERGALVRTALRPTLTPVSHWPYWAVFFALAAAAVIWLTRAWHGAPATPPSAAVSPSAVPPSAPPVALPSASVVGSAAATIPKDLENPF